MAIELVKVVMNSPIEHYKNAFLNLALPLFVFSEPAAAVKMKMRWLTIYTVFCFHNFCLQCFDAVGWVAGRASGL